MVRCAVFAVSIFVLGVFSVDPAVAEKRVALVIGNSAYRHAGELTNPKNDATDMSIALRSLGFQVIDGFDLDKPGFDRKIRDFATALQGAKVGVFFYAGHGLQVSGQNYLVPVDAQAETAGALDFEMIRLDLVHRTMEREAQTNIIFLDACRNNPLARNLARAMGTRSTEIGRGLAQVESGVGTLISFSTQPGNVALDGSGRNSPFAESLIKHISASSEDLSAILIGVRKDVMAATQRKQVPWEHSALEGRFFFKEAPLSQASPQSVVDVFRKYELFGTWVERVEDCSKAPSRNAAHLVHRQIGNDAVERELLIGDAARPRDRIVAAEHRGANVISMTLANETRQLELSMQVDGKRMRAMQSQQLGGPPFIANGRFASNNTETPWLTKCR